jgi:hypoxanthine phosphoribosyltransferase
MRKLREAIQKGAVEYIVGLIVAAVLSAAAGSLATWSWFRTAIALNDVVSCVANVKTWLNEAHFQPDIFVAGWSGGLILTELLVKEFYGPNVPHPPTYLIYELPADSPDTKYKNYGTKFVSPSTNTQFFIPHAIQGEDRNAKILIFDDWANTGKTLDAAKDQLKKMGFKQVRTAVVAANEQLLTKKPDRLCFPVSEPYDKLPWKPRFGGF